MSLDYAALKVEVQTDPAALGYAALAPRDNAIADLMNAVRAGATYKVNTVSVSAPAFVNAVNRAEYDALTAADKAYLSWLVQAGEVILSGGEVRSALAALFGAGTVSRTNFLALASRQISRAELLFGQPVSASDVALARIA